MSISTREAFESHAAAIRAGDLDAVVAGYAPDAVLADSDRIGRGHDYIRAVHAATMDAAAALEPTLEVLEEQGVVFVSWRSPSPHGPDLVGTNTFVIEDGLITVNTAFMTNSSTVAVRLDEPDRETSDGPSTTITEGDSPVTLVNVFTVSPENQEELVRVLGRATEDVMAHRDGFVSANIHASTDGTRVTNYAQWRDRAAYGAILDDPVAAEHMNEAAAIADSFDPHLYSVRSTHHA